VPDRIGCLGNGPPRVPFATAGAELGRLRDAGAPTFKIMAAPRETENAARSGVNRRDDKT